jgi:hypothetical protein
MENPNFLVTGKRKVVDARASEQRGARPALIYVGVQARVKEPTSLYG